MNSLSCSLWFYETVPIPPALKVKAAEFFGSAEEIYGADEGSLSSCPFLSGEDLAAISEAKEKDPDLLLKDLRDKGISFVSLDQIDYPERLRTLTDRPYGLYFLGSLPPLDRKAAAVVGSRRCSAYGASAAKEIAYLLARAGYIVISGMARGVDSCGQAGCLEGGAYSAAVLGSGVDVCYPPENKRLYDRLAREGGIISEFYPGTAPAAEHFPQRNRLISGLSDLVIVVEARERSGSLITAQLALNQGRTVLCVPGRINDPMSVGTNRLIEAGAGIIPSTTRLLSKLTEEAGMEVSPLKRKKPSLTKTERAVYDATDYYARSSEAILNLSKVAYRDLILSLLSLAEKGLIRESYPNTYVRTSVRI